LQVQGGAQPPANPRWHLVIPAIAFHSNCVFKNKNKKYKSNNSHADFKAGKLYLTNSGIIL